MCRAIWCHPGVLQYERPYKFKTFKAFKIFLKRQTHIHTNVFVINYDSWVFMFMSVYECEMSNQTRKKTLFFFFWLQTTSIHIHIALDTYVYMIILISGFNLFFFLFHVLRQHKNLTFSIDLMHSNYCGVSFSCVCRYFFFCFFHFCLHSIWFEIAIK